MPKVDLALLPDSARAWIFASERALTPEEAERVLAAVDGYLADWAAHGTPLRSGCELREGKFLIVAVDERAAGASGCSIDWLYRALRQLETGLGTRLMVGGKVFARDARGAVQGMSRDEFTQRSENGEIDAVTTVFDTSLTSLGAIRSAFETEAGKSWHASLLAESAPRR